METCSQADFIGRGPDGHYTLIDFGSHTRRKANQLQKQMLGMAQSFKEGGNSIPRITPFVGRYMVSPDCKDNILQFVPPDLNLFDPSLKIIGKILHNKETNERTRQEIAA